MKLKVVVIDLELSAGAKRWIFGLGGPVLVLAIGGGIARAKVQANQFQSRQPLTADSLNAAFYDLQQQIDALKLIPLECPLGYSRDNTVSGITLCKRGADEVVKVGTGGSAFWIDRYEASVWSGADGTGTQYGGVDGNGDIVLAYPASFPANGQRVSGNIDLFAASVAGVPPSANITWFQAQYACRASGKRLATGEEWLAAANGTLDSGDSTGVGGACLTNGNGARLTGGGTNCVSTWGVQDMIGNVWDWTADWFSAAGESGVNTPELVPWSYNNGDATRNVPGAAFNGQQWVHGLPAAAVRGGGWGDHAAAGVLTLNLDLGANAYVAAIGFRCVVPR